MRFCRKERNRDGGNRLWGLPAPGAAGGSRVRAPARVGPALPWSTTRPRRHPEPQRRPCLARLRCLEGLLRPRGGGAAADGEAGAAPSRGTAGLALKSGWLNRLCGAVVTSALHPLSQGGADGLCVPSCTSQGGSLEATQIRRLTRSAAAPRPRGRARTARPARRTRPDRRGPRRGHGELRAGVDQRPRRRLHPHHHRRHPHADRPALRGRSQLRVRPDRLPAGRRDHHRHAAAVCRRAAAARPGSGTWTRAGRAAATRPACTGAGSPSPARTTPTSPSSRSPTSRSATSSSGSTPSRSRLWATPPTSSSPST